MARQVLPPIGFETPAGDRRLWYLFNSHSNDGGIQSEDMTDDNDQMSKALKAFRIMCTCNADSDTLTKASIPLVQTQVTKTLRLEAEIEPEKPLMAYGLDSLSAVELRGWVRQNLGAQLSTLDITNASSLTALCKKIVSRLPQMESPSSNKTR